MQKRLFLLHLMTKVIKNNRSKKEMKRDKQDSDFLRPYFAASNQTSNILFPVFIPQFCLN